MEIEKRVVQVKELVVTLSPRELAIIEDALNYADDNFSDVEFLDGAADIEKPEVNALWLTFYTARKGIEG